MKTIVKLIKKVAHGYMEAAKMMYYPTGVLPMKRF